MTLNNRIYETPLCEIEIIALESHCLSTTPTASGGTNDDYEVITVDPGLS